MVYRLYRGSGCCLKVKNKIIEITLEETEINGEHYAIMYHILYETEK